jgi:hypothetical protein
MVATQRCAHTLIGVVAAGLQHGDDEGESHDR